MMRGRVSNKHIRHLQSISVENNDEISGWLEKQSKHLKQWRERFVVIYGKDNKLKTYKTCDKKYETLEIELNYNTVIIIMKNNYFEIKNELTKESVLFRTQNKVTLDRWLDFIHQKLKYFDSD